MPFSTPARNRLAGFFTGAATGDPATHLSLHFDIPDALGSSELTGGSPAYARIPVVWNTAADGIVSQSGSAVFNVPGGSTVSCIGFWSALTDGTFLGYVPANGGSLYGYGMGRAADSILSPAHGLVTGDTVLVRSPVDGGTLPSGYAADTIYRVSVVDADTFHLQDVNTQVTVSPTTSAALVWTRIVVDTFASQGTMTVAALQIGVGA